MILLFFFFFFFSFFFSFSFIFFSIISCSTYGATGDINYSSPRSSIVRIQQRLIASPPTKKSFLVACYVV